MTDQAPMTVDQLRAVCDALERHLRSTKKAYYTGVRGVTYDDLRAAGERLLRARSMLETALGRKPRRITTAAVLNLIAQ